MQKYYAVVNGISPGVYSNKTVAHKMINSYKGNKIGIFNSFEEAQEYFRKSRKEIKRNEYCVLVSPSNYTVVEITGKMSLSSKSAEQFEEIRFFKNNQELVDFFNRHDFNPALMINDINHKNYSGARMRDLYDYTAKIEYKANIDTKSDVLTAYTDGAFHKNENIYTGGVVLFNGKASDETKFRAVKLTGKNNELLKFGSVSGEIIASVYAINYALENDFSTINLFYDFQGVAQYANEVKFSNYISFLYSRFIKNARKKIKINFIKVKAHSGNSYNNMADRLTRIG